MCSIILTHLMPVCCTLAPAPDPTKDAQISILCIQAVLRGALPSKELQQRLNKWRHAPLYQQLSAADELIANLLNEDRAETPDYRWEKGTHDRSRIAGRAAWALEQVFNVKLPAVEPTSTAEDLKAIHRKAAQKVEEYRAAELKRMQGSAPSLADLKKAYRGKIKVGVTGYPDTFKYVAVMDQLLQEWFPLGKKIEELEEITGVKGTREKDAVIYVFDTGDGGIEFFFRLQDGIIRRVELHPTY